MQQRVERAAANASEVRAHLGAFAVEEMADEAGFFRQFMSGGEIHRAVEHHPAFFCNELEFVGGKIFANVWMTTMIVRIDPKSGVIDGIMDMSSLVPAGLPQDAVLNGIAWDEGKKRLYVTGKLWPKVFELELGR